MKRAWLVPLTGIAFIVLLILGFIITGDTPEAKDSLQDIVDFYKDDKDSIEAGAFVTAFAAILLVFFANYLRNLFRESVTSATILVGAAIVAVSAGIDATILVATAEAADDIEPTSVQTLQALWDNDWVPFAIGLVVFDVSIGLSILRTAVLPRWLGWVVLVIALIGVSPIGFVAFPLTGILVIVLSVWLALRERRASAPPPAAAPA
jgi:hypothetical protein